MLTKMRLTIFPYENNPMKIILPKHAQRKTIPVSTQASKKFLFNLARLIRALIFGIVLYEWLINATKFTIVRSNVLTITNILIFRENYSVISELLKEDHLSSRGVSARQNFKAVYRPYDEN